MKITLELHAHPAGSRVLLDGVDVSEAVYGVEVRAFAGELVAVTLHVLSKQVEMTGDVALVLKRAEQKQ